MSNAMNNALAGFARNLRAAEESDQKVIKAKPVTARVMNKAIREGATKLCTQTIGGAQWNIAKCPKRGMIKTFKV